MGEEYSYYENALKVLGNEKLSDRRTKLCLNFAKKSEKHEKFQHWFELAEEKPDPLPNTRSDKTSLQTKYKPVTVRTDRYKDSPLPYLTELLNSHYIKKK